MPGTIRRLALVLAASAAAALVGFDPSYQLRAGTASGSAVPEPATAGLMVTGVVAMVGAVVRLRHARR